MEEEERPLSEEQRWKKHLHLVHLVQTDQLIRVTCVKLDFALLLWNDERVRDALNLIFSMQELQELSLKGNQLRSAVFDDLPVDLHMKLRKVDVSQNKLGHWPSNFLRFNFRLEYLDFTSNSLRHVPGFFLDLPCLKYIRRDGNRFADNYPMMQTAQDRRIKKLNEKTPRSFASLETLSFLACMRSSESFSTLPQLFFRIFRGLSVDVIPCEWCYAPLPEQDYFFVHVFPPSLGGATYLPVKAKVCSEACANRFFKKWDWSSVEGPNPQEVFEAMSYNNSTHKMKGKVCCTIM